VKNRWVAVFRDGILISLPVFLVRYIPALIEFPKDGPFIYGWAILGALTTLVGTVGFLISGCLGAERRRWHLPRVLGLVWFSGLISVVPNSGHYLIWSLVFWLQSIVPLGLAMLFGGALSYWFVKEPAETPPTGNPAVDDRPPDRSTRDRSGIRLFTLENLLIFIGAETSLILVASAIYENHGDRYVRYRSSGGDDFFFCLVVIGFLIVLPLYNFRSTTTPGLFDPDRYVINRVIAGLTITFAAVLLNVLIALNYLSPALGMVVGPLMIPVVLVAVVMGLVNLLIGIFNNPRKRRQSG